MAREKKAVININQICQDDTPYPFIFKYRFPTIDFKFQNTGTATGSMSSVV
jgi:hypothetical protein